MTAAPPDRTAVYRIRGEADVFIYIGITNTRLRDITGSLALLALGAVRRAAVRRDQGRQRREANYG
jgi:hypothetical protein